MEKEHKRKAPLACSAAIGRYFHTRQKNISRETFHMSIISTLIWPSDLLTELVVALNPVIKKLLFKCYFTKVKPFFFQDIHHET